jgi:pimeloyl-ACP methyl ester carboxylesterase
MWAARRADSVRDFLVAVNLWCFSPRIWNEGIMDEWLTEAEANPHQQSVEAFCRSTEALLDHDTADRLGAVSIPTLVTVGELDLVLPTRFSRELAARIPGARLVVVPDAGHQPFQELPAEYNRILHEFLEAV